MAPLRRGLFLVHSPFVPLLNHNGRFLHVGCGHARLEQTPFASSTWQEVRLDVDPAVAPDLIGSITAMPSVAAASMDAVYSSHNIEHLYAHEVPLALAEFRRVLTSDGFLLLTCPDLRSVAALVAADRLTDPIYRSDLGLITPLDILYGHRSALAAGNHFMAHRCGFTAKVLVGTLQQAGFAQVACCERPNHQDLWALATNQPWPELQLREAAAQLFPSGASARAV